MKVPASGPPALVVLALAGCLSAPGPAEPVTDPIPAASARPGAVGLAVEVVGLESDGGRVAFALFADAESFAAGDAPVRGAFLPPEGGRCLWTVDDLPPGRYAVKAYHDLDDNGRLDFNAFGVPSEPYGFSNGARGRFGPPPFDEAAFTVGAEGARVVVAPR